MNKIRKWLNKPKKEVENQLMIQPLTPERRRQACHDVTAVMNTLSSTPQRLATLLFNLRDLDGGLISQTRTDRADPDLILTTRLSMLGELLHGHVPQEEHRTEIPQQPHSSENLRTMSGWSPQTSAVPPAFRTQSQVEQVEQVTGNETQVKQMDTGRCATLRLSSGGGRATDTLESIPGRPVRLFLKTRDDCSLPSSTHPGGRRGLTYSLPCSPLLGGKRWGSPPSSPSPPLGLSRHWVEAALQRSKHLRQTESCRPPPCPPQVGQEGQKEGQQEGRCIRWEETEDEDEESEESCLVCETLRYCQLTPCVCLRCPSAPPYEAEVFSAGDTQTSSSLSSEDQKHSEGLAQLSLIMSVQSSDVQRSEGGCEQSLPRDSALQRDESPCVYPSLSLWKIAADGQTELKRKQEEEVNSSDPLLNHKNIHPSPHANNTDNHLQWLDGSSGQWAGQWSQDHRSDMQLRSQRHLLTETREKQAPDYIFILKKVFHSTTCSKGTAHPTESCSFCSDKFRMHLCRHCDQMFCHHCLSHFVSLLQIHHFSQTAASSSHR